MQNKARKRRFKSNEGKTKKGEGEKQNKGSTVEKQNDGEEDNQSMRGVTKARPCHSPDRGLRVKIWSKSLRR